VTQPLRWRIAVGSDDAGLEYAEKVAVIDAYERAKAANRQKS
jgi:hypothetical protein